MIPLVSEVAFWSLLSSVLTVILGVAALIRFAWKSWLPHLRAWIDAELVQPIADVRRFAVENGDKNPERPTARDQFGEVFRRLDAQDRVLAIQGDLLDDHFKVADGDRLQLARLSADVEKLKGARS